MADQNMANQRLQEILEQKQKKLLEELNASNFLKDINNPERKRWFLFQPYEKMPNKLNILRNDPLFKYLYSSLNPSNKDRILKATSKEKLDQELKNLENKIAASPRYDLKYAGLLEGPFAAKPQISGAVEWFFKVSTVIAIAAIIITASASLGPLPILISSIVAPACYAAMRFTRGLMFRTQQNDLLKTSKLELQLETFQEKIKALEEQQEFFRNNEHGKEYVKNLTKTLNSDLVQTYSKLGTQTNSIKNHIQNNLLKYDGKDKSTLNQLKANLTTLIDTNEFVKYNKDNQTLQKNFNLDFDKNKRIIKAVQALVDSKLAENANAENENGLDLSEATFLTPKDSNNTYIISENKVYQIKGKKVTDTGLNGKGENIATGIAVYDKSTGEQLKDTNYLKELKEISGLEPKINVQNLIDKIGESKDFTNYADKLINEAQYTILKNITNKSERLEQSETLAFSNIIRDIISDIYNNKEISEKKLKEIGTLNWKHGSTEEEEAAKAAEEAAAKAEEEAAKAQMTAAAEEEAAKIKELLQEFKAKVQDAPTHNTQGKNTTIQEKLKNLKGNGGIPEPEDISKLFGDILNSAKDIQEPLIGEMRNLGISLKPENNIKLPSTMSHIQEMHNKGR